MCGAWSCSALRRPVRTRPAKAISTFSWSLIRFRGAPPRPPTSVCWKPCSCFLAGRWTWLSAPRSEIPTSASPSSTPKRSCMPLEPKKYLYDIQEAASQIVDFTSGKTLDDYRGNAMLRSAVERQFEIIGEALAQLARLDEKIVARISEHRRIIAFRNILIHGYADIDERLVWDIVQANLPTLRVEIERLFNES